MKFNECAVLAISHVIYLVQLTTWIGLRLCTYIRILSLWDSNHLSWSWIFVEMLKFRIVGSNSTKYPYAITVIAIFNLENLENFTSIFLFSDMFLYACWKILIQYKLDNPAPCGKCRIIKNSGLLRACKVTFIHTKNDSFSQA